MVSYMSNVRIAQPMRPDDQGEAALSPIQSVAASSDDTPDRADQSMRLVVAGYSYGSMIASHLPPIDVVLEMLRGAHAGSAETEICLRASHLARLRVKDLKDGQQHKRQSRGRDSLRAGDALQASHAVSMGGYESESTSRRISRDSSRRSLDVGVRKSLERVKEKLGARKPSSTGSLVVDTEAATGADLVAPEVCYLLISPLLPPVAGFTTMFSTLSFTPKKQPAQQSKPGLELTLRPSCAVYGDKDTFTSQKRLRRWAEQMKQKPESRFCFYEISDAGHFWHERAAADQMKTSVREWLSSLDVK